MNYNRKVVVFTLVTTSILLLYSLYASLSHTNLLGLNNVSIVSDVLTEKKITDTLQNDKADTFAMAGQSPIADTSQAVATGERSLKYYKVPRVITAFSTDTSKPSLPNLMRKLALLRESKKGKVRVAWLGDSMIEGDLLTQTFRKRIQQMMGGYGVGFVPATSVTASFRSTVSHKWKGDWKEENFKTKDLTAPLFLSGHTFFTSNGELMLKDITVKDSTQALEKSLICGAVPGPVNITVNGQAKQYHADKKINRLLLDNSTSHSIDVVVQNEKLPVYGISMEPASGVVIDNFSFRGITGVELGKLDSAFLNSVETENTYDLVILEYGANLMFRPDDMDYSWYQKHIIPVVKKLQRAMPHTEFLIISTADRAFAYDGTWKSAVGIDNLIKTQAELAYSDETSFYNMFASMGGAGTIVSWADTIPSLANKDYIHPNQRGAEILGNMLYDDFMNDFRKGKNTQSVNKVKL